VCNRRDACFMNVTRNRVKLYIVFDGTAPPVRDLVMESDDRSALKERACDLANEICGSHPPVLMWSGHHDGDEELALTDRCGFVIRK